MKNRLRLDDAADVLTVLDAARILGLGRNQCYELVRRGAIPSLRLGRSIRVPKVGLVQMMTRALQDESADGSAKPAAHGGRRDQRQTPK